MCCDASETLYGTSTITTSVATVSLTTTTRLPYGTVSAVTTTSCRAWSGTSCIWTVTKTDWWTMDFFDTETFTKSITKTVPTTQTTTFPTATESVPCTTIDATHGNVDHIEHIEARGGSLPAVSPMRLGSKGGILILGLLAGYVLL